MVRVMYLIHVCYEAHINYNFRRANYILVYELHRYHDIRYIHNQITRILIGIHYIIIFIL